MATSSGLAGDISDPFDITPGPAVTLGFIIQPAGAIAKSAFTTQPVVWVEDANGNIYQSSGSALPVTLSITPGTGTQGAVLSGTTTINSVFQGDDGVAAFQGLSIDLAGSGYKLVATSSGLTPATSNAFDVAASSP